MTLIGESVLLFRIGPLRAAKESEMTMDDYEEPITLCAECQENEAVTPQGFCKKCDEEFFSNSDS